MGRGSLLVKVLAYCSEGCEFKSQVHQATTVESLNKTFILQLFKMR